MNRIKRRPWIFTVASCLIAFASASKEILDALVGVVFEEDARKVIDPHLDDVKKIDATVIEKVVFNQWWNLAQDIVSKSHTQGIDLSFSVRKAVRALKDEADELLRTLNPKYGQAQQVSPAFQWAQNDTSILLTVKFTVRWNAPGAVEVTEPEVNMLGNGFNFTGFGKHSNNKYKYMLGIKLFDNILPEESSWNLASVGKLSVTLRKKWPRKWPRLLADKKTKIGNMHVWMEHQERIAGQLAGMSTVAHSPMTCKFQKKLYCPVTDTCKTAETCSQCPGKNLALEESHECAGPPSKKAEIAFTDADLQKGKFGGVVKITPAKHEYESDQFLVYWGKNEKEKVDEAVQLGEAGRYGGEFNLEMNTKKPDKATHLLVFSKNTHGEYEVPGYVFLKDASLPSTVPKSFKFDDKDNDQGEIEGSIEVDHPDADVTTEKYAVHWGKSETERIDFQKKKNVTSYITDFYKGSTLTVINANTKIPQQASHLLLYAKNAHGEHPNGISVKLEDHARPCNKRGDEDCPGGVTNSLEVAGDFVLKGSVKVEAAKSNDITGYVLHWGRSSCDEASPSNGKIKELSSSEALEYVFTPGAKPDASTHILVYSRSKYGDSKFCVSTALNIPETGKKEL